jgi:hypothetical protein
MYWDRYNPREIEYIFQQLIAGIYRGWVWERGRLSLSRSALLRKNTVVMLQCLAHKSSVWLMGMVFGISFEPCARQTIFSLWFGFPPHNRLDSSVWACLLKELRIGLFGVATGLHRSGRFHQPHHADCPIEKRQFNRRRILILPCPHNPKVGTRFVRRISAE